MNNKKYLAVLSVAAIASLVSVNTAFAADGDVYNTATKQLKYTKVQYTSDVAKLDQFMNDMILNTANVGYEFNGNVLKGTDVTAKSTTTLDEFTTYLNVMDKDVTIVKAPVSDYKATVSSVSAITTTAFNGVSTTLGFAINGATTQADLKILKDAGYEVSYESNVAVSATGILIPTKDFQYKVVISKDAKVVAESALQTVKVTSGSAVASITKAHLVAGGVTVNTVVPGDNATVAIDSYVRANGDKEIVSATDPIVTAPVVTYKSSDSSVLVVKANGEIIPLSAGTANVVISKDGMADYTISVKVATDARVATTLEGLSAVQLNSTTKEEKTYSLVLKDQYGDLMNGKTMLTATSVDGIATVSTPVATTVEGKTSFKVTAAKAGTVNVTVKDATGKILLGTAAITVKEAGAVNTYGLEYAATSDATLDLNTGLKDADNKSVDDSLLKVNFVSRDASGLLVANLTNDATYTITSSKPEVATIAVDGTITAKTVGTTTITVKEGTLTRATLVITVKDTTKPAISKIGTTEVIGEIETQKFGAFTAIADADTDASTITLQYADIAAKLGDLDNITFNTKVKVKSMSVGGVNLTSDQMGLLTVSATKNITTAYNDSIDLDQIDTTVGDLVKLGSTIKVTIENESGLDNTYTITLAAPAAN